MDPSFTYTVADLAQGERVKLKCDCRVRTYTGAEPAALVGRNARLHLVGLHRTLWRGECGEPQGDAVRGDVTRAGLRR